MSASLDLPDRHARVLIRILELIDPRQYPWALTGSAGLRLQGVDVPVHDLDLQADFETIFRLGEVLEGYMTIALQEKESEHTRSVYGVVRIDGLQVELMGDVRHRTEDGGWDCETAIESLRLWVKWNGRQVPVLPLEHEAAAYDRMRRPQKAELIREAILRSAND